MTSLILCGDAPTLVAMTTTHHWINAGLDNLLACLLEKYLSSNCVIFNSKCSLFIIQVKLEEVEVKSGEEDEVSIVFTSSLNENFPK